MTERTFASDLFYQTLSEHFRNAVDACICNRERRSDDRVMLQSDCQLGRILKAMQAYEPVGFDLWASEYLPESLRPERVDLMRLADVEGEADTYLAARGTSAGPYSLGTVRDLLAAVSRASASGANAEASGPIGRQVHRRTAERTQKKQSRRKRARSYPISTTTRNKVRRVVALWRTSRKLEELRPLLSVAASAERSPVELVRSAFKEGPFLVSLLPHLAKLDLAPSKARSAR